MTICQKRQTMHWICCSNWAAGPIAYLEVVSSRKEANKYVGRSIDCSSIPIAIKGISSRVEIVKNILSEKRRDKRLP